MGKPLAKVLEVHDDGNDVLRVVGEVRGAPAVATGWVSATTNHYPSAAYDRDGRLKLTPHKATTPVRRQAVRDGVELGDGDPVHKPRQMNEKEIRAYARRLLLEQNPPAPTSTRIL